MELSPTAPAELAVLSVASSVEAGDFLPGVALATAIGLLIGAERGWRMRDEEPGTRVAGVRTFAILGLLGGLLGTAAALHLELGRVVKFQDSQIV